MVSEVETRQADGRKVAIFFPSQFLPKEIKSRNKEQITWHAE